MATILHSIAETKMHAPLSSGQTIAVFQHLHSSSQEAFRQIDALRKELERKGEGLSKAINDMSTVEASLQDLRQAFKTMGERVHATDRQACDSLALSEKLKKSIQMIREDFTFLREGQQKTNTNVHILHEDLKLRSDDIGALRKDVDEGVMAAIAGLEEKARGYTLSLKQLTAEQDKSKQELSKHRDGLQALTDDMKASRGDLESLDTSLGKQDVLLKDACTKLEATKKNLEITNAVVLKMNESRDGMLYDMANLKEGMKSIGEKLDAFHFAHAKTVKDLATTRKEVGNAVSAAEQSRQDLNKAMADVSALQQGYEKYSSNGEKLAKDLANVKNLADSTLHHLEATNAMVLPNLSVGDIVSTGSPHKNSESPRTHVVGSVGRRSAPATPRKRREPTWVARNIGTVPDRMSWI